MWIYTSSLWDNSTVENTGEIYAISTGEGCGDACVSTGVWGRLRPHGGVSPQNIPMV